MTRRLVVSLLVIMMVGIVGARSVSELADISLDEAAALGLLGSKIFTVNKFGYNAAVTGAPEESIWDAPDLGGPLRCFTVLGSTAAALFISSSAAGDATEDVTIEGLTTGYVPQTATITLGATAAASGTVMVAAGTWLRINRMYATDTALTGDVYVSKSSTDTAGGADGVPDAPSTTIVAVISAGENQTLQACYTVPAGYNALMTNRCLSNTVLGGADTLTFRERAAVNGGVNRTKALVQIGSGDSECVDVHPHKLFAEKTDIEITGSGTTQAATAEFGLILVPNTMR